MPGRMLGALGAISTLLTMACGPGYLTPDEVRQHIESPRGTVAKDTVGRATDDYFQAQKASRAESMAGFIKAGESSGDGAAAWAAGVIEDGAMEKAVAMGAVEDIGDLFCAASLVASISTFDSCSENSNNCEAELIIDSCVMRIGEGGDELARGKIRFKVKNQEQSDFVRSELRIEFEDFESTLDAEEGITQYFEGIIAIETTEWTNTDSERDEVIFSCDLREQTRSQARGLFDDGILTQQRLTVAMRFVAEESADTSTGTLELLAFLDESDDTRDESVVVSFEAESRRLDDSREIAGATLSVRGSNGAFTCTWSAASEQVDAENSTYEASGSCVDAETGEEFTWSSEATYSNS